MVGGGGGGGGDWCDDGAGREPGGVPALAGINKLPLWETRTLEGRVTDANFHPGV